MGLQKDTLRKNVINWRGADSTLRIKIITKIIQVFFQLGRIRIRIQTLIIVTQYFCLYYIVAFVLCNDKKVNKNVLFYSILFETVETVALVHAVQGRAKGWIFFLS